MCLVKRLDEVLRGMFTHPHKFLCMHQCTCHVHTFFVCSSCCLNAWRDLQIGIVRTKGGYIAAILPTAGSPQQL